MFSQAIDVSFAVSGMDGWPKLLLEVGFVDEFERMDLAGYGMCFIPSQPGEHIVDVQIFRPAPTLAQSVSCFFLGGYPRYVDPSVILAGAPRYEHYTNSVGSIQANFEILCKGFGDVGVHLSSDPDIPFESLAEYKTALADSKITLAKLSKPLENLNLNTSVLSINSPDVDSNLSNSVKQIVLQTPHDNLRANGNVAPLNKLVSLPKLKPDSLPSLNKIEPFAPLKVGPLKSFLVTKK